jgi:thiosulfate dehydrogenase [quinone] large subunit
MRVGRLPKEEERMMMQGMTWVRILVGAVWLNGALEKLLNPHFPKQFAQSLKVGGFISQAPPFFRAFMEGVVAPNAETFAQVVRFVELSLGIALLLGLLTNLASLGSIAQSLAIMLSQGGVAFGTGLGAPEFLNVDLIVTLLSVIILLSPGAKALSVDAVLTKRTPALSTLLINRRKQVE